MTSKDFNSSNCNRLYTEIAPVILSTLFLNVMYLNFKSYITNKK